MGLASVRAFAERNRGAVAVESDEGVGTTVTLSLPAVTRATPS
jgi:signal transduction histidine kinase